ncbi:MAG: hypothetical protein ACKOWC_00630, partial [Limnohabitans sp.]
MTRFYAPHASAVRSVALTLAMAALALPGMAERPDSHGQPHGHGHDRGHRPVRAEHAQALPPASRIYLVRSHSEERMNPPPAQVIYYENPPARRPTMAGLR